MTVKFNISNIIVVIISILIGFYFIEIAFYLKNTKNDEVTIFNKFIELENEQVKPVTIIYPNQNLKFIDNNYFSLGGISNRITILCSEEKRWSIYLSDRFGFRNNDNIWDEEIIDYLLIGDSFTQGACVENENTISQKLAQKLNNNKHIINLGYGGTGPLYQLALLREYFPEQKVDKVLWFFFEGNDLYDLKNELKSEKLIKYLNKNEFNQELKFKQGLVDTRLNDHFLESIKPNLQEKKIINIIKLLELRNFVKSLFNKSKTYNFNYKEYKKILIKAKKFVEINNTEIILVYLPIHTRFYGNDKNLDNIYDNIKKMSKDLNIKFIDTVKNFEKIKEPNIYYAEKSNKHFNVIGYDYLSKIILKDLD